MLRIQSRALAPVLDRVAKPPASVMALKVAARGDAALPVTAADTVWRAAGVETAVALAADIGPSTFGLLTYLVAATSDVAGALRATERYFGVLSEGLAYRLELGRNTATLLADIRRASQPEPVVEAFAATSVVGFVRSQAAGGGTPLRVQLKPRFAPGPSRVLREFFAAPVEFGARHNAIVFERSLLDAPLRGADPGLLEILVAHAQGQAPQACASGIAVLDLLITALPGEALALPAVAGKLGMSGRTLRRRLAEEGTSFQALVDQARRHYAEHALREPAHRVTDIARALGYADASAFRRAFRRWTGLAPAHYRLALAS